MTHRRWSFEIGKLFGIAIRMHVTLGALLISIAIAAPIAGATVAQLLVQGVLVIAVFASVVVHELAHALVARRFACETHEILLLPIGGIAQMERMPVRPTEELLVAIAGPATNMLIAGLAGLVVIAGGWPIGFEQPSLLGAVFVPLFWINVGLALFNLVPAFPMDGGRVLRALLAMRVGQARATRIATLAGKAFALGFVLVGLAGAGAALAIIGIFVWFAAEVESASVAMHLALARATVADAMLREPELPIVKPELPLERVIEPLGRHGLVLVGDHRGGIVGVLSADQLATYAATHERYRL